MRSVLVTLLGDVSELLDAGTPESTIVQRLVATGCWSPSVPVRSSASGRGGLIRCWPFRCDCRSVGGFVATRFALGRPPWSRWRTSARPSSWVAGADSKHPPKTLVDRVWPSRDWIRRTRSESRGISPTAGSNRGPLHKRDRRPGNASPRGGELRYGTPARCPYSGCGTDVFPTRRPAITAGAPRAAWISERRGRVRARGGH